MDCCIARIEWSGLKDVIFIGIPACEKSLVLVFSYMLSKADGETRGGAHERSL